jgi:hypothetical protein
VRVGTAVRPGLADAMHRDDDDDDDDDDNDNDDHDDHDNDDNDNRITLHPV